MFDVGFSELLVIAVVALLVLGPERLPKAARFAGLWVRRARSQWNSVKAEFERDLADDELKRTLHETQQSLREAHASLREAGSSLQRDFQDASDTLMRGPTPPRAALPATAAAVTPSATQALEAPATDGAMAAPATPASTMPGTISPGSTTAGSSAPDGTFAVDEAANTGEAFEPDPEISLHAPMDEPPPPLDEDDDDASHAHPPRPRGTDPDATDAQR